jgi:hypothetical protein
LANTHTVPNRDSESFPNPVREHFPEFWDDDEQTFCGYWSPFSIEILLAECSDVCVKAVPGFAPSVGHVNNKIECANEFESTAFDVETVCEDWRAV